VFLNENCPHHFQLFFRKFILSQCKASNSDNCPKILASDVNKFSVNFPPCMLNLHLQLLKKNRLKHHARVIRFLINHVFYCINVFSLNFRYSTPYFSKKSACPGRKMPNFGPVTTVKIVLRVSHVVVNITGRKTTENTCTTSDICMDLKEARKVTTLTVVRLFRWVFCNNLC